MATKTTDRQSRRKVNDFKRQSPLNMEYRWS